MVFVFDYDFEKRASKINMLIIWHLAITVFNEIVKYSYSDA